jgi:ribA/ribD-fused uncharacterized protein
MNSITMFKDEFSFLSNFAYINIIVKDKLWKTSEHMYMACKTNDPVQQEQIRLAATPGKAKYLGRSVTLRSDWNDIKDRTMLRILRLKFTKNLEMGKLLLATGNTKLVEGNYWHDNYWGACNCPKCACKPKLNTLGKLLMQVRYDLLTVSIR